MSNTFCVLPWIHLATHPHGGCTICCVSDHTKSKNKARNYIDNQAQYLNLSTDSINDIMNSDYYKEVRLQMLSGEKPEACLRCFDEESKGIKSKRVEENSIYQDFTYNKARFNTFEDGRINTELEFVELRLGNTCNVKCRTCNPASSSKWVKDYRYLRENLSFLTNYDSNDDYSWPSNTQFWEELLQHSTTLKVLYINGGEPTLIKEHWEFLKRLVKNGIAQNLTLWYNINMTTMPKIALDIWRQFKEVKISCSIDCLENRNHYIRYPTKWSKVIEILDQLQSNDWINTSINQTISWMNYYYLNEFYSWVTSRGLYVHYNFVYDPEFLSPKVIPLKARIKIHEKLREKIPDYKYDSLINMFGHGEYPELWNMAQKYSNSLDKMRNERFSLTFKEFNNLLQNYS